MALVDPAYDVGEGGAGCTLGEETARAGGQGPAQQVRPTVTGEDHTGTSWELPAQLGDDAYAVHHRHLELENRNVGPMIEGTIDGLATVSRARDPLNSRLALQQHSQRLRDQLL